MKAVENRSGRVFAVVKTNRKKTLRNELLKEAIFPEYQVIEKTDAFWICLDSYDGDIDKRLSKAKNEIKEYLRGLKNDLKIEIKAIFVHDNFNS